MNLSVFSDEHLMKEALKEAGKYRGISMDGREAVRKIMDIIG